MAESGVVSEDLFMKRFKSLKRRNPPADLSTVIDVDNATNIDKVLDNSLTHILFSLQLNRSIYINCFLMIMDK